MGSSVKQVLALQKNQDLESTLFRFKTGWSVRFVYGSTLFGQKVNLFINYPSDDKSFVRSTYRQLDWKAAEQGQDRNDQTSLAIDVQFKLPGTFRYHFVSNGHPELICGSGYFLVEPRLTLANDNCLPLDSIQCQTVLSKCLGHFDLWRDTLVVSERSGYNVIHFTPIQELGASNSAYSIKNQLKLNHEFSEGRDLDVTYADVGELLEYMRREWSVLSITDIVLNHTANETPWIQEHPECGYNLTNTPHLRPAFLLDRVLWHLTLDIISGKWEPNGVTVEINNEDHLNKLKEILREFYLPQVKIEEMFLVDVERVIEQTKSLLEKQEDQGDVSPGIRVIQDPSFRRHRSLIDVQAAAALYVRPSQGVSESWISDSCVDLRRRVESRNCEIAAEVANHLNAAIENVASAARYERVQWDGPKIKKLSREQPLVPQYFTFFAKDIALKDEEALIYDEKANVYFMAHNGWVMDFDPLRNFASADSNVYLRRELIAWGDSVKLRFGNEPSDCPFLWSLMKEYVEQTARTFHGIRLDNCHSTPLNLAEYLIDAARAVRPDLYVIAELFTCSEHLDNIFVNRLGINSLIRESMACSDSHELGRLVHRFGGDPVGAFMKPSFKPLQKSVAHAVFFDQTHDNESVVTKRSPYDLLASSAIIAMSSCATGSNRGYDEIVPHHIHVVNESRRYGQWSEKQLDALDGTSVSYQSGIVYAKRICNDLHQKLQQEGFTEIFVDQVDSNVIAVTRHNPNTHKSVVLVGRTCFTPQEPNVTGFIRNITIAGKINEILFEAKMIGKADNYAKNEKIINGLSGFYADVRQHITVKASAMVSVTTSNGENSVRFEKFAPSSVVAFDVSLDEEHLKSLNQLKTIIAQFQESGEISKIVERLDLDDLNYVLFRIDQEEKDDRFRGGAYDIPGFGSFNYCGLAGLMNHWKDIRTSNDLGHPICGNLRDGDWLPSYIAGRLQWRDSTKDLSNWLKNAFTPLSKIPRYMIPRYFDAIIAPLYSMCLGASLGKMSRFIKDGSKLAQHLAIGGLAMVGFNPSAPLPPLAINLPHPKPPSKLIDGIEHPVCPTIAAGLPHFSSGYMRNWGRDTFIALRGLLLVTGRYAEARNIILGFAGCLRHGLIPNLLDRGIKSRYNCRDAVWFWLQCIKDYCNIVPDDRGYELLNDPVQRLYPSDDSVAKTDEAHEQPLHQVVQEALLRHFRGIDFLERNWGIQIDEHMQEEGFHVKVGVNRDTGFVYGGNQSNCGTWMDKMGSSSKAGNRGIPSSPRDGSPIELVGLSWSVVSWLHTLKEKDLWPYEGVTDEEQLWTWKEWADRIAANFEANFYVNLTTDYYLINRREIYKDTVGATQEWQDYQLRPNYVVAMAVAPGLFDATHARRALEVARDALLGPLGMRTLDPSDWNYRGDYDNSNDSTDMKIAHGFNYHQGPEWLWPVGYYLRAQYKFAENKEEARQHMNHVLAAHYQYLEKTPWLGLPELTNSNGSDCHDSCATQAWSISTLLDALFDVQRDA